jgi:hypothetical protein
MPAEAGIQYPAPVVLGPKGRSVLDAPHARGMTNEAVRYRYE